MANQAVRANPWSWVGSRIGSILLLLFFLQGPGTVRAQLQNGVSFLDADNIILDLTGESPDASLSLKVFSGSAQEQTVHLELSPFRGEGSSLLSDGALMVVPRSANMGPAGVYTFTLTVQISPEMTGEYQGEIFALSSDGSLARLPLTLVFPAAEPSPSLTTDTKGIDPVFLGGLNLESQVHGISFLSPSADKVDPIQVELNARYAGSRALVGQVSGAEGRIGQIWRDGSGIQVVGLTKAGEYTGKADLMPGDPEAGELPVTVQLHDALLFPLLTLVLGLLLTGLLDHLVTFRLPLFRLENRLVQYREEILKEQDDARKHIVQGAPWGKEVFRIVDKESHKGLLDQATGTLKENFREAYVDSEREKWGPTGEEMKKIAGYKQTLSALLRLQRGVSDNYVELSGQIDAFEALPVAKQVRDALKPELIESVTRLEAVQEKLKSASLFLDQFSKLYQELTVLRAKASDNPEGKKRVEHLFARLLSVEMNSSLRLSVLEAETGKLATELFPATGLRHLGEEIEGGTKESAPVVELQPLADLARLAQSLLRPDAVSLPTPGDVRRALGIQEALFNFLSALVVITTGLYTVYLSNPTFGKLTDYLSLLLWGSVTSAGIQLARQVAPILKR